MVNNQMLNSCMPMLKALLKEYQPKLIIPLGNLAINALITSRTAVGEASVSLWRGFCIPDQELKAWVAPIYHPDFLRNMCTGADVAYVILKKDLARALGHLDKPLPDYSWIQNSVKILEKKSEILEILEEIASHNRLTSIDYETTGLKPYRSAQEIVSLAVAFKHEKHGYQSYSFMYNKELFRPMRRFLASPCPKISANLSFEQTWTRHFFNVFINNLVYDPVIGMHVLDNRSGITSVKFQTYVYLGIADYSSHIKPYLESSPQLRKTDGSHAFNNIRRIEPHLLLRYGGMDAIVELIVSEIEMEKLGLCK